jgi:hypothetical protein
VHMTIEPLHMTRVSTSRKRQTYNETMKSLLDMLANVILTVHCPNDYEVLSIISHSHLEMTLCNMFCTKVCTVLYSSQSVVLFVDYNVSWFVRFLDDTSVQTYVYLCVKMDDSKNMHVFQEHTYVEAGHVWTQSKISRVLCTTFRFILCSHFLCCLLLRLQNSMEPCTILILFYC